MKNFWLGRRQGMTSLEVSIIESMFVDTIRNAGRSDNFWTMKIRMLNCMVGELGKDRFFEVCSLDSTNDFVEDWAMLGDRLNQVVWREEDADQICACTGSGSDCEELDPEVPSASCGL
jgi:hypothetical protein